MQITDIASINDYCNSIIIQNDGKILALGTAINGDNYYVAAARYQTNGNIDNSFGLNGTLIDYLKQGSTFFTSSAIQKDGKIIAAGYSWNGVNYDFALARYNLNGSLDNTFSTDGLQMTDFGATDDKANAIAIQTDGKSYWQVSPMVILPLAVTMLMVVLIYFLMVMEYRPLTLVPTILLHR